MIRTVELGNFISHYETKIELDSGVTVFVGHNGAGKSSVIDAITFALFGEHTRNSNKGLIRRGAGQAYARVVFSSRGKDYEAVRKIDSKGTLSAQFFEIRNGEQLPIAMGERKQFGESMTQQVEETLGLDFNKLKVASIVQQGELGSIIKAKPKEFKELLNAIIGIDKLDAASEGLKIAQKNFRSSIQKKFGYDDTHIEILKNELDQRCDELKKSEPMMAELKRRKELAEQDLAVLDGKIKSISQKEATVKQLEERKREIRNYIKEAIIQMQKGISEKERKVTECEGCFESARLCNTLESSQRQLEDEISNLDAKIRDFERQQTILQEHKALAKKLQLQDGKCPVCNSAVEKLKPVFREDHLQEEGKKVSLLLEESLSKRKELVSKKNEISLGLKKSLLAKRTLDTHAIQNQEQLAELKNQIKMQREQIQKIPPTDSAQILVEASSIDSHAKLLCKKIQELQASASGFDPKEFESVKSQFEQKRRESSRLDQEMGATIEKIEQAKKRSEQIGNIISELSFVRDYIVTIGEIQSNVYNRDGPVATSLRSWALETISAKASEYLETLNTKIHRVALSEKVRDVTITCYSKNTVIDIDSLSGGEQVSVALALRLGMADLFGASGMNFVILDEPTTHLDEQRRKSLVRVLSQLSDVSRNGDESMQFIVITHDAEIFEDSSVEKIYKFESSPEGTRVALL